jgi:hypothetical protein
MYTIKVALRRRTLQYNLMRMRPAGLNKRAFGKIHVVYPVNARSENKIKTFFFPVFY